MQSVASLSQLGPDFGLLHAELIALFHRLAMTQLLGASPDPLAPDAEQLQSFASLFTAEELQQGAGLSFDTALRGAGAYRVEARLIPRHLLHLLGDESTRYDKEYPYLFSGSIYVGNIARHGGRCQSVPLPP